MNITGGKYNGRKIQAPPEKIVRPTLSKVRMSVFNTLYSLVGEFEGKSWLDMFGGSGIMGLEALSRGFEKVVIFEKNKMVSEIIKNNYSALGLPPELTVGDSLKLVKNMTEKFDVIYIDPPYMSEIYSKMGEDKEMFSNVIKPETVFIFEHNEEKNFPVFEIIKQKKYGDKFLTFCKIKN